MAPRGRAFVGSDVYLGAQEAAALVAGWGEGVGYGQPVRGFGGGGGYQRGGRFQQNREAAYRREHPIPQQQNRGGGFNAWDYVNPLTPWEKMFGGGKRHHRHHHHHRHPQAWQQPQPQVQITQADWEAQNPDGDWYEREGRREQWEIDHPGEPFVGATVSEFAGALAESAEALGIFPKGALVDAARPNMLVREPLPMSTGTAPVGIGLTAQITSRPQRIGFRPERLFVSSFSLDGLGAAAWTINDITIGNVSQLAQAGNLPGDMFANIAIDSFVTFKTAQTAMDVVLVTTYNGTTEGGIPFTGSIIGSSAAVG